MNSKRKRTLTLQLGLTTLACACLIACGGSSSPTAAADPQLTGVAAYGAPMAGASITLMDAAGTTKTATADSTGRYTLNVTGLTAPFLIKASMPSGDSVKEYSSLVMTAPKAGDTGVANVTPLTHALVSMISSDGANPNEFATATTLKSVDASKLDTALKNLQAALADVLSNAHLPANFDPMTANFKADRTSDADVLLDTIKVSVSDQGVMLTNARFAVVDGTGAAETVTLNKLTPSTKKIAPPNVDQSAFKGLDTFTADANACLALAPEERVSRNASVASAITYTFLNACANVTGFASNYKAYGYSLTGLWGPRLLEQIPANSKLMTPEFLLFLDDGKKAIVRLASSSPNGGRVYFEVAGKAADGSWQIIGNQRNYDASVGVRLRRSTDLSTYEWAPYSNIKVGKRNSYESILTFGFNQSGPKGEGVYAVRVKGPGLPSSGIVLARSSVCGTNDYLAFYRNDGQLPSVSTEYPSSSGNPFWYLDAATFGDVYKGADFYNQFRGLDNTGVPSSSPNINKALKGSVQLKDIPEFALYTWEVFTKDKGTTPAETFTSRITTRPLAASEGSKQPWATFNQDALDYVDPKNVKAGELTEGQFSWTLSVGAPAVTNGYIYGTKYGTGGWSINMGNPVTKLGNTSLSMKAASETNGAGTSCGSNANVPAFTSTTNWRQVGIRQVTDRGLSLEQTSFHDARSAN